MKRRSTILSLICVGLGALGALLLAGCGGEQEGTIDSSSAAVVQKASSNAVNTAVKQHMLGDLQKLALGQSPGSWLTGTAGKFEMNSAVNSALGGSLLISGAGALESASGFMDLTYKITLKGWKDASGAVLDGVLDVSTTVKSFDPVEVNVKFKGTLDVSGAVQAQVPVDLSLDLLKGGTLTCGKVSVLEVNVDACAAAINSQAAAMLQAWAAYVTAQMQAKILTDAAAKLAGAAGSLVGAAGSLTGSLVGAAGGVVQYSGSLAGSAGAYTASVKASIKGWKDASGATIDGELTLEYDLGGLAGSGAEVTIKGQITINGKAKASVDLAVTDGGVCGTIGGHSIKVGLCS